MSDHTPSQEEQIAVLREMIRLAENRRMEEHKMLENVNRYNLALIAFSAGFLSLLVTANFSKETIHIAGFMLLVSILVSLLAIAPRTFKGTIVIYEDIEMLRKGEYFALHEYLLLTAEAVEIIGNNIDCLVGKKRNLTMISGFCLFLALLFTYSISFFR